MKTITKYRRTCNDCQKWLTESEVAHNEMLCNKCQHKRNSRVLSMLIPLLTGKQIKHLADKLP